jgi:hypothetical protein
VPVGNPEDMAKAIAATLEDAPNREALQKRANDFSLEKALTKYGKLLQPAKIIA